MFATYLIRISIFNFITLTKINFQSKNFYLRHYATKTYYRVVRDAEYEIQWTPGLDVVTRNTPVPAGG
jgi:hypothetical protein